MPTNVNAPDSPSLPAATKKSSTVTKLVQAAALTAVLIPLGSVPMEAGPITCGFTGASGAFDGGPDDSGCSITDTSTPGSTNTFTWYDGLGSEIYRIELTFHDVDLFAAFTVVIDDVSMTSGQFATRAVLFPDYSPIPVVDPDDSGVGGLAEFGAFRDFYITTDYDGDVAPWDTYDFLIHWIYDSENNGYPGGGGRARVLHDIGEASNPNYLPNGNVYDEDMCIEYGCTYDTDPGIRSGDKSFQSLTPALAPVPEPASLILLATGLSGVLYGRRRRTKG